MFDDDIEEGDDGVLHELGQLDPEVIEQLRAFKGDPDPGRNQARDIPSSD